MNSRITQTIIRVSSSFLLSCLEVPQAAGQYRVDYGEEPLESVLRLAWRRIAAFVYLPATGGFSGSAA
ncbi:hypothetical protein [Rhizobium binxianense]